jgi:hypothetical protein
MRRRIAHLGAITVISGLFLPAPAAHAAVLPGGAGYFEDFDSMGAAGTSPPAGWTSGVFSPVINRSTDGNGAIVTRVLTVDDGSNGSVGLNFNHGVAGTGERALGGAGTTGSGDVVHQLELTNATGAAIGSLNLSYRGEQWRVNQSTSASGPEMLRLYYSTNPSSGFVSMGSAFDFTAPQNAPTSTKLVGNDAANSATISGSFTLPAPVAEGGTFYLRWLDWNDNSTTDHPLSIDNVSVQGVGVPEPGSVGLIGIGLAFFAGRRSIARARRSDPTRG